MPSDITSLLRDVAGGDKSAEEQLLLLLHAELRRMAVRHLRRERKRHTLQPTELLNEVYLRLLRGQARQRWNDRVHFFAVASTVMRRYLVDYSRKRATVKRGQGVELEELTDRHLAIAHSPERIIAVDSALSALAKSEPRQARIVELRFFAGLTDDEIAEVLGVSSRTVKRDWVDAKKWLYTRLRD